MKRMKEPTQLMTPTLTRLDMRSPNTFLQDVQKLEPLKAGENGVITCSCTVIYYFEARTIEQGKKFCDVGI